MAAPFSFLARSSGIFHSSYCHIRSEARSTLHAAFSLPSQSENKSGASANHLNTFQSGNRSFHSSVQQHSLSSTHPLHHLPPWSSRRGPAPPHALPLHTMASAAVEAAPQLGTVLSFTPGLAGLGGAVLGVATVAKLLLNGRVLGISGAVKGLVQGDHAAWRYAFLVGMLAGAVAAGAYMPSSFQALPDSFTCLRTGLGGLLVGFGAAMGNGCTSGHGICGNSRLSPRSMAYTVTFMLAGFLAAGLTGAPEAVGIAPLAPQYVGVSPEQLQQGLAIMATSAAVLGTLGLLGKKASPGTKSLLDATSEIIVGFTFALGLALSGMTQPAKVIGFLSPLHPAWDLSLMFVMGGAIAIAVVGYQSVLRGKILDKPLLGSKFQLPTASSIDKKLITGGLIFGSGWGMSGMCPGPAIVSLSHLSPQVGSYLAAMCVGMYLEGLLSCKMASCSSSCAIPPPPAAAPPASGAEQTPPASGVSSSTTKP